MRLAGFEVISRRLDFGPAEVGLAFTIRNPGRGSRLLHELAVGLSWEPSRVLEQGWQSWSPVRRCAPTDPRPARSRAPFWLRSMLLADPKTAGRCVTGEPLLVFEGGALGFLGGAGQVGVVEAGPTRLTARALLEGEAVAGGAEIELDPLLLVRGKAEHAYRRLIELWAHRGAPAKEVASPYGWCSWYQYFERVEPQVILKQLALAAAHGLRTVQLDDGFQHRVGDWLSPAPGWEQDDLESFARAAVDLGVVPGIWLAPFVAAADSALAAWHPGWLLHRGGRPVVASRNPAWGTAYALDATHPQLREHLHRLLAKLAATGFRYFKLDYLYAAALAGDRWLPVNRMAALQLGLQALRQGLPDDCFVLACGCPLAAAVGLVDAMRVSPDTGARWEDPPKDPVQSPEPTPSASAAVRTAVLRAPMHRRLWINDPDCVLLRNQPEAFRRAAAGSAIAGLGGSLMASDALDQYGSGQWAELAELRRLRDAADRPQEVGGLFSRAPQVRSEKMQLQLDWSGTGTWAQVGPPRGSRA